MPAVARLNDLFATGHPCDDISQLGEASGNVFVNGRGAVRLGDLSVSHLIPVGIPCLPHVVPVASASGSVFVNGIGVARVGDSIDAGAII